MPTLTLFHYFVNNVRGGLKIKMKEINLKILSSKTKLRICGLLKIEDFSDIPPTLHMIAIKKGTQIELTSHAGVLV